MAGDGLDAFRETVERATTTDALWRAFRAFLQTTAAERASYLHLPPLGAPDARQPKLHAEGYPDGDLEWFLDNRIFRDSPILREAQQRGQPIYWDDIESLRTLTWRERQFMAGLRELVGPHGVGVPVFGPNGRDGQFGLSFRDGVARLEPAEMHRICDAAQALHLRYCTLFVPQLGPLPELSGREGEILSWVAQGKSNTVIGEILGISPNTVDAHLRRVYLKLGVYDRISAAVRGMGIGLIYSLA